MHLVAAVLRDPAHGVDGQLLGLDRDRGVQHVDRDQLPLPGAFPVQQAGQGALERAVPGDGVHRVGARRARAGRQARPTLSMAPLIACSSMSWPGRLTYGPLSPYPEIETYTMSGRTARMDS